ncbi:MAG: hypothetical protein ACYTGC_00410 [Planctomycetota bacterium]|jgi:hypothetical protein
MAISTTVAKHYAVRMIAVAIFCAGFGIWGAYDYFVKIPRQVERADRFEKLTGRQSDLEALASDGTITSAERDEYSANEKELASEFGGDTPSRPGKFDRITQIIAMSCLLGAPYFFWMFATARRQVYRLEDDGTLLGPGMSWAADDIVDIDMDRWMAKSVAFVVHRDGRRLKLDDYIHRDMHLIVGRLATRFHPDQWHEDGKLRKAVGGPTGDDTPPGPADAEAEPKPEVAVEDAAAEPASSNTTTS